MPHFTNKTLGDTRFYRGDERPRINLPWKKKEIGQSRSEILLAALAAIRLFRGPSRSTFPAHGPLFDHLRSIPRNGAGDKCCPIDRLTDSLISRVTVAPTDQESTLESAPVVSGGRRPRGEAAFRVAGTATRQSVPLPPDCLPRRGFPDSGMRFWRKTSTRRNLVLNIPVSCFVF